MRADAMEQASWVWELRDRAHEWLVRTNGLTGFVEEPAKEWGEDVVRIPRPIPMAAYADLIFAFGLARLGQPEDVQDLLERPNRELAGAGDVHSLLYSAYAHRILQALQGEPLAGRLPTELRGRIADLGSSMPASRYAVDRACAASRILEPDVRINPYRFINHRGDKHQTEIATLCDSADVGELRSHLQELNTGKANAKGGPRWQDELLLASLGQARWAGVEFAEDYLAHVLPACDRASPSMEIQFVVSLLAEGVAVAYRYGRRDFFLPLAARIQQMVRDVPERFLALWNEAFDLCVRGWHKFGLRHEIEDLLADINRRFPEPGTRIVEISEREYARMRCLPAVAVGRYVLGQTRKADEVIEELQSYLFTPDLGQLAQDSREEVAGRRSTRRYVVNAYPAAVACSPDRSAVRTRIEELFGRLEGVEDTYSTMAYFSQCRIQFLEAVVLAATEPPPACPEPDVQIYPTF
jgi:hypothetical protein